MDPILASSAVVGSKEAQYRQDVFNLKRSQVKYAHMPLEELYKRGFGGKQLSLLLDTLPPHVVIAGGYPAALFNQDVTLAADVDLFFTDSAFSAGENLSETVSRLLGAGYIPSEASKEMINLYGTVQRGDKLNKEAFVQLVPGEAIINQCGGEPTLPVQAIKICWFDSAEHVIDSFDFTAIQFGIDVGKKELVYNPVAPMDYAQRQLVIHNRESDARLEKRIEKYVAKGFKAPK